MTTEETTTEQTDEIEGVIHQPTLPTMELPDYHGRKPVGMKTALAGAGTRVTRPHTIGDRIVLVIEARVKSASHEDTDDGLVYSEKLKVLDLFELDPGQGSRLISTVRSLYRTGEDAIKGRRPIPDLGDTGYTDASGVVLTPAEVAELRGDPIRAILSPELTPAVIVYDDGARDLWPDDYPKDAPRPKIGEKYLTEGGDAIVTQLLHHETGEPLEEAGADVVPSPAPELDPEIPQPEQEPPLEPAARPPLAAVPDLPEPTTAPEMDPYAGDLGDDADGWETAEPLRPLTAEEEETARIEAYRRNLRRIRRRVRPPAATVLYPYGADGLTVSGLNGGSESLLPTSADFAFVDCQIPELLGKLAAVTDLASARRIELAEKQGRGRGLKARAGAMTAIGKRVAELTAAETGVAQ